MRDLVAVKGGRSRFLLAQFGLTPKSKRGLAASNPGDSLDVLGALWNWSRSRGKARFGHTAVAIPNYQGSNPPILMRIPIFQVLKPASIFDIRITQFFQGLFRATCATTGSSVKNQFSGLVFGDFANPFRNFRVWNPNCVTKMSRIPFFLRANVDDEFLRSCLRRVTLLSGISIGLLRFVDLSCVR